MQWVHSKESPHILKCGQMTIEKSICTPQTNGKQHIVYRLWDEGKAISDRKMIPCRPDLNSCKNAAHVRMYR